MSILRFFLIIFALLFLSFAHADTDCFSYDDSEGIEYLDIYKFRKGSMRPTGWDSMYGEYNSPEWNADQFEQQLKVINDGTYSYQVSIRGADQVYSGSNARGESVELVLTSKPVVELPAGMLQRILPYTQFSEVFIGQLKFNETSPSQVYCLK